MFVTTASRAITVWFSWSLVSPMSDEDAEPLR